MSKNPKRHIIILGGQAHQDTDPLPEKEPGMEFWAQNPTEQWIYPKVAELMLGDGYRETDNVAMLAEVVDRWYEIHDAEQTADLHPKHVQWLSEQDIPVYVQDDHAPEWAGVLRHTYPIECVQALTPHGRYLAGTFSYMVAHAILEGVDKISFHWMGKGVTRSPSEPRDAQTSLEYWLGVAEGRGIEVDPGELWLLRTWWDGRYGFDGMPPEWHRDRAEREFDDYLRERRDYDYEPVLEQLKDYLADEAGQ